LTIEGGENGDGDDEKMVAAIDRIERLFDGRRYAEVVELCTVFNRQSWNVLGCGRPEDLCWWATMVSQ
jgi:hypothetical protein